MSLLQYQSIIEDLPLAFAYHKIITNDKGKATDYVFLDVNKAFEIMTGLSKEDIINKPITEVFPGFADSEFDWIKTFGDVAQTRQSVSFQQYSEHLKKTYDVTAFSHQVGYFGTIFTEITDFVNEKDALMVILEIFEVVINRPSLMIDYQALVNGVAEIADAAYVALNLYDDNQSSFKTVAISGDQASIKRVESLLNINLTGHQWSFDAAKYNQSATSNHVQYEHLRELVGETLNQDIIDDIAETYQCGNVHVVNIVNDAYVLGDFTIIMAKDKKLSNFEYIKIFSDIIGEYLDRKKIEILLHEKTNELEGFFDVALDLLAIADTKGNFMKLNRAWEETLGYPLKTLLNTSYWDHIHPDDIEKTVAAVTKLNNNESLLNFVNRYRTKDGTYKYIEWRTHPKDGVLYTAARDISERVHSEQALRNSEQRFRMYTQKAPLGVFIVDALGHYIEVNEAATQMSGYSYDELMSMTLEEFVAPEFVEQGLVMFQEVLADKSNKKFEAEILGQRKNKEKYWVSLVALKLSDDEVIGFVQDITEKKAAQEKLEREHNQMLSIFDGLEALIYVIDLETYDVLFINNYGKELFGDVKGEKCWKVIGNQLMPPCPYCKKEELFEDLEQNIEFERYNSKAKRWYHCHDSMISWSDDRLVKLHVAYDITDKKMMEKQLYLEKEQFKTTLLSVSDGIIATDNETKITVINEVAQHLTGFSEAEALGKYLDDVFVVIDEKSRESLGNLAKTVLTTKKAMEIEGPALLITKDGLEISVDDGAAPIIDAQGNINGVVIVFRDYSEKREKQRQVEYLSYHDYLTGLYNRRYLEDSMVRMDTKRNMPFSILVLDVNGLKLTNDAYGHSMGDQLIKTVAKILQKACRADDIMARTGGDEFVVLLPKTTSKEALAIKQRINMLASEVKLDSVIISLSIGTATKTNENQDIHDVLKDADNNMYRDKIQHGRNMRNRTIENVLRNINTNYNREQVHTERVAQYCEAIGRALDFSDAQINEIKALGILHDIGKIAISPEILNKKDKLTEKEWEIIKQHPITGYNILKNVEEYANLAEAVLYHHERIDGSGYPNGLSGSDIPLYSRIIAIADAYEAMTAIRSYQISKTKQQAIDELKRCSGTQFDESLVNIFIEKVLL